MHFSDRFQSLMYLRSGDYYSVHVVYYISKFKIALCEESNSLNNICSKEQSQTMSQGP